MGANEWILIMDETWESRAGALAESIAGVVSADLGRKRLSEKLLQFTFTPSNQDAAEMRLIVSPHDVILGSGRGTQLELEALPASGERVLDLARAIAGGGLSERLSPARVKFELRLQDGTVLRGSSKQGLIPRLGRVRSVTYAPYRSRLSDG